MRATTHNSGLSALRLRQALSYDPETGLFRWKLRLSKCCRIGAVAGCRSRTGYIFLQINGTMHLAHRLAWLYVYGEWPPKDLDHINLDKADNRICNLREADASQNGANKRMNPRNKSGYRGVHYSKQTGKWRANIQVRGKATELGHFPTKEEAAEAYRKAAEQGFGEFARAGEMTNG